MDNGRNPVQLAREKEEFLPSRELVSGTNIDWATILQHASIVLEAVSLAGSGDWGISKQDYLTMKAKKTPRKQL